MNLDPKKELCLQITLYYYSFVLARKYAAELADLLNSFSNEWIEISVNCQNKEPSLLPPRFSEAFSSFATKVKNNINMVGFQQFCSGNFQKLKEKVANIDPQSEIILQLSANGWEKQSKRMLTFYDSLKNDNDLCTQFEGAMEAFAISEENRNFAFDQTLFVSDETKTWLHGTCWPLPEKHEVEFGALCQGYDSFSNYYGHLKSLALAIDYEIRATINELNEVCKDPGLCSALVINCSNDTNALMPSELWQSLNGVYRDYLSTVKTATGAIEHLYSGQNFRNCFDSSLDLNHICSITTGVAVTNFLFTLQDFYQYYYPLNSYLHYVDDPTQFCKVHNRIVADLSLSLDKSTRTWTHGDIKYHLTDAINTLSQALCSDCYQGASFCKSQLPVNSKERLGGYVPTPFFFMMFEGMYRSSVERLRNQVHQMVSQLDDLCQNSGKCISLIENCKLGEGDLLDPSIITTLSPLYKKIIQQICLIRILSVTNPAVFSVGWQNFNDVERECKSTITPMMEDFVNRYQGFVEHYKDYVGFDAEIVDPEGFCKVHNRLVEDLQLKFDSSSYAWHFDTMKHDLTVPMQEILSAVSSCMYSTDEKKWS